MAVETKPLFSPEIIRQQLAQFRLPDAVESVRPSLRHWADLIASGKADEFNEVSLLPDFISDFFDRLLGYTGPASGGPAFTRLQQTTVVVDGQTADAALGRFTADSQRFVVAVEGKSTRDPLDRPFGGRRMSAVDQAYRYAINLPCDWIVVTSMRETRLYHKGSDQHTYERFETVRLADDEALLSRFVFLLGAERVVPESGGPCHLDALLRSSESAGRELTHRFYTLYAGIRQRVFAQLRDANPATDSVEILRCTQKLLDRVLFCAFCEDRGLLPADTVRAAFTHHDPYHPRPIWENFRGLFRSVDAGNAHLKIPAYNGGLFAADPGIDALSVPDDVCACFRDLAEYDYRPAREAADLGDESAEIRPVIDVDILGHIFEQSITDLERLRQEMEAAPDAAPPAAGEKDAKSRRKKEGAFYTPAFITRYIVAETLGAVLRDRFETLRHRQEAAATGTARKTLADPAAYDLPALNDPQRQALIQFWEAWQDELKTVRVLDPACGSGAFLIETFDQLHAQYGIANARLEELRGHRSLFDPDRQILQHNLYGVDLNAEAIQICQLSLWIKTAAHGKALTSLDHTIREGNSVVADPAVHPKAFDWQTAFPEVFAQGGFDVIVGNPPYIRQEWIAPFKPYWEKRYRSYHGVADIFVYFFEQGIELLRPGGQMAYITSGSWVRGNFGAPLRKFLSTGARMVSMIDFGEFQPFEDAEMIRPTIAIAAKETPGGKMRLFKWLTSGTPPETLSEEIAAAPTVSAERLSETPWELEADRVLALREKISGHGQHKKLKDFTGGQILYGVKTGLNDVFVVSSEKRAELIASDPASARIIKPLIQGTHLRPWYVEESNEFLIFTRRGIRIEEYPAVSSYLGSFRRQLEPKPENWDEKAKWPGRKSGSYKWYELQDTVDYWSAFEEPKIVWSDISKLPRFSMEIGNRYLGNTGYFIPGEDYYLLGILSSWATWFFISKTSQPLRLRGDRWQYRLFTQSMEHVPIPDAPEAERRAIADLAQTCGTLAQERYRAQIAVQRRLRQSFGNGTDLPLNQKAEAWWEHTHIALGDALKQSFKLSTNPMKSPRTADEWEPYLDEKRAENIRLTSALANAEGEINDRVYRLFGLTPDEIRLLQKEVEH